ncbi:hypothetical protein TALC_01296 [Thermoplasmatales archaeon BRNA1]|nr:hypothetical protein TALC_01296 [Thermoplasmatales archaeon BRNA1]
MMSKKSIALLAFMFVAVSAFVAVSDDGSDAAVGNGFAFEDDVYKFTEDSTGSIKLKVIVPTTQDVRFTVTSKDGAVSYYDGTQTVASGDPQTVKLKFSIDDTGTYTVKVTMYEGGAEIQSDIVDVKVSSSVWSGSLPYIAIIVIAIIVVIAIFLYLRNRPKTKPSITFTELEAQKKAEKGEAPSKPAQQSTDKKRYEAAPKDEDSEPVQEGQAPAAKKSDDGKKLKYTSFRRK